MLFALALLVIGAQSCAPTYHPSPTERPDTDADTDTSTGTDTETEGTETEGTETGSGTLETGEYRLEVVGVEELSGCGIRPADIMGATATAPIAIRGERAIAYLDPVLMRGELADGVLVVEGSVLARLESDTDTDTDTEAEPPDSGRPGRTVVVGSAWIEAEVLSSTSAEGLVGYDDGSCVYVLDVTLDRDVPDDTDTDTDTTDCGEETDCG